MPLSTSGLVLGTLIADAAAVNVHWVYPFMKETYEKFSVEAKDAPEFFHKVYNPFYRSPLSPYGIQVYALLESFVESKGYNTLNYKQRLVKNCGANTIYDNPPPVENPLAGKPLAGGWKNHGLKHFIEVVEKDGIQADGALENDHQIDGAALVPIISALYIHDANFFKIVEDIVGIVQKSEKAVTAALITARLYQFIEKKGLSLQSVLQFIESEAAGGDETNAAAMKELLQSFDIDILEYVQKPAPGINCAAPGAVYTLLHNLVNALKTTPTGSSKSGAFITSIRKTLLTGGCSASRACIIGGLFGGTFGKDAVPNDWLSKTTDSKTLLDLATALEKISIAKRM